MKTNIKLHKSFSRLKNETALDFVWISGINVFEGNGERSIFCLTPIFPVSKDNIVLDVASCKENLPTSINILGFVSFIRDENSEADNGRVYEVCLNALSTLNGPETISLHIHYNSSGDVKISLHSSKGNMEYLNNSEFVKPSFLEDHEQIWKNHILMRCQFEVCNPYYTKSDEKDGRSDAINSAFKKMEDELNSNLTFIIDPPSRERGERYLLDPAKQSTILCSELKKSATGNPQTSSSGLPQPWLVKLLPTPMATEGQKSAPSVAYTPSEHSFGVKWITDTVDVLAMAHVNETMSSAVASLVSNGVLAQITQMRKMALQQSAMADIKMSAYHFMPPGIAHPITAVYSLNYGEAQEKAVNQRQLLHCRFGLPLDRPLFRAENSLKFAEVSAPIQSTKLKDVHVGLSSSGVVGGTQSLVQGSYEYFHYKQDKFDDSGWGCAYRSLQTIISWFRMNQYTALPVPSHRKIQQTLVEIGDKEVSFLGSRQWIGAIELGYVLDQLLGVTCKVLTVQSGADMPTKGRQLAHHFQTQGTPVMIGGGVLAYTLLGIDYNERTGECAFLILDPHYTGGEDLRAIRGGGWVGWKKAVTEAGQDFFVRSAFYNLLLPQRPATV